MFDGKRAFSAMNGKLLTYIDLRQEIERVYAQQFHNLPPEFGPEELLEFMRNKGWLTEHHGLTNLVEVHIEKQLPVM